MIDILHFLGIDDTTGRWYAFWSGVCGDLFIFGAVAGFFHKHNCHQKGCPRIGKHTFEGTPYCTRHHPPFDNSTETAIVKGTKEK